MTLYRRIAPTLLLIAFGFLSSAAGAAPRDAAAKKKIDEAINTHYLQTNFDKAESVLLGVIQACEDKCSPGVKASAWMYIGIIRGSGRADEAGATDAFLQAVMLDPGVQLDDALATPETKRAFQTAKAQGGTGAPTSPTPSTPSPGPGASPAPTAPPVGTMLCTPTVREMQTRRALPISCETPQPTAAKGVIFYKEFGGEWQEVPMQKKGTSLQGTVPCEAAAVAGKMQVYVEGRDANGNVVDMYGTRTQPIEFTVLGATTQPPPAFPGMEAPPRCEEQADCPPDFPGCKGNAGVKEWGDSCGSNDECQTNFCSSGSCEFCQTNEDCPGKGTCNDGFCSGGSGGGKGAPGKTRKVWVGVHFAADIPVVGGNDICSRDSQTNGGWNCFYPDPPLWSVADPARGTPGDNVQYPYNPNPNASGKVNTGLAFATVRALVSLDYTVAPKVTVGGRAGFAFNGGPKAAGASFLPVHAEARFGYWFVPLGTKGLHPYVQFGGGLGQVDAKVPVKVLDCNNGQYEPTNGYAECVADTDLMYPDPDSGANPGPLPDVPLDPADEAFDQTPSTPNIPAEMELDAYRRMGQLFVAPAFGVVYAFTDRAGIQLNVDAKILFPTTGFAISPSLGFVYGL